MLRGNPFLPKAFPAPPSDAAVMKKGGKAFTAETIEI